MGYRIVLSAMEPTAEDLEEGNYCCECHNELEQSWGYPIKCVDCGGEADSWISLACKKEQDEIDQIESDKETYEDSRYTFGRGI